MDGIAVFVDDGEVVGGVEEVVFDSVPCAFGPEFVSGTSGDAPLVGFPLSDGERGSWSYDVPVAALFNVVIPVVIAFFNSLPIF